MNKLRERGDLADQRFVQMIYAATATRDPSLADERYAFKGLDRYEVEASIPR